MYSQNNNSIFYENQPEMKPEMDYVSTVEPYNNRFTYSGFKNEFEFSIQSQPLPSYANIQQTPQINSQESSFPTYSQMYDNNSQSNNFQENFHTQQVFVENPYENSEFFSIVSASPTNSVPESYGYEVCNYDSTYCQTSTQNINYSSVKMFVENNNTSLNESPNNAGKLYMKRKKNCAASAKSRQKKLSTINLLGERIRKKLVQIQNLRSLVEEAKIKAHEIERQKLQIQNILQLRNIQ